MRVEARLSRLENAYALHHVARMSQAELRDAMDVLDRHAREGWERLSHEDHKRLAAIGAIFFLPILVEEDSLEENGAGEVRAPENRPEENRPGEDQAEENP